MKLLHTGDWHLGHTLYDHNRTDEQIYMLDRLIVLAEQEKPDAFLVSGDIFDSQAPGNYVQTLLVEKLMELRQRCPAMAIVLTAGNHDSASRHEIHRKLWDLSGIEMIGFIAGDELPEDKCIVELPGKGIIIAVPFLPSRRATPEFYTRLLDAADRRNSDSLPVILMAHTAVAGCDITGHSDSEGTSIGNIDCRPISDFGNGYDYAALGHIHRRQVISGTDGRMHYSGTPLRISFDEPECQSVNIVEIEAHGALPTVRPIEIPPLRRLVNLPATGTADWASVLDMLRAVDPDDDVYIRLNVAQTEFLPPDARARAYEICNGKKARFCTINFNRISERDLSDESTMSLEQFSSSSPLEIAQRYLASLDLEYDDDFSQCFDIALETLSEQQQK